VPISWTISRYIGLQFLVGVGMVFGVVLSLVFVFDVTELMRQTSSNEQAGFGLLASMSLLKLPSLTEKAAPFAILFGAMWSFLKLTRSNELVVVRASGVSVWQFMAPPVGLAFSLGLLATMILNPLSATMLARHDDLAARNFSGKSSLLAMSDSGLWLRQVDSTGQSVIHALRSEKQGIILSDVIIFLYEGSDAFSARIDAARATLKDGAWHLEKAWATGPDRQAIFHDSYTLPTSLTPQQIQESFASPATLSFWDLPAFIDMLETSGFTAVRHRLHLHTLLASPALFMAMVLIAATFSLRHARGGGIGMMILGGVLVGFALFFVSDVTVALGTSGGLPVILAAWAPAAVSLLLGLASLFYLEDG